MELAGGVGKHPLPEAPGLWLMFSGFFLFLPASMRGMSAVLGATLTDSSVLFALGSGAPQSVPALGDNL